MRVFVTGASGYIGWAVANAFRSKGHRVWGLVRSNDAAVSLMRAEIEPVMGDIKRPESFHQALDLANVYVHCAFEHSDAGVREDLNMIRVLIDSARKAPFVRTIVYTSGCWIYGSRGAEVVDEYSSLRPLKLVQWRPDHEKKLLDLAVQQARVIVMRPGVVYGGSRGLTALWFSSAAKGSVFVPGDGSQVWPMIHVDDLARAYVLAAEREVDSHQIYNIADSSCASVAMLSSAVASSAGIHGRLTYLDKDKLYDQYGALAEGLQVDLKLSCDRAQRLLGWRPFHASFLENVDLYWRAWRAAHVE